ncbi:unnamed protein product, partial [Timema podura]|nr:unnamed protein product [Timema podura]
AHTVVCYCDGHCPDDQSNGTCVGQPGSHCFSAVEEVINSETGMIEIERTYGCLPPDERGFMQCKGHLVPHLTGRSIQCCNNTDLCNKFLTPRITFRSTPAPDIVIYDDIPFIALILSLTICLIAFIVALAYFYLK